MQIIPAIDLQNGRAVRLVRGDFTQATDFGDPVDVAHRWIDQGAELIHVVDLDGAREGRPVQLELVRGIAASAPIELGGGLRTERDVDRAMEAGARRVVIGTAALDVALVEELVVKYGDALVVALDTRSGMVATRGWTEESERTMLELAESLIETGVRRFLHTDVERDGTLTEPNYDSLRQLIALGAPVIASGGISSVGDIVRLRDLGAEATIVGTALYQGTVDLPEAIDRAR